MFARTTTRISVPSYVSHPIGTKTPLANRFHRISAPCLSLSLSASQKYIHGQNISSDEEERKLSDQRTIFVRDLSRRTKDIQGKLLNYFFTFGEVENVWILRSKSNGTEGFAFVTFKSPDDANRALKEKHFFDGQWLTTTPKTHKGVWKGKSNKVKVDNVPQEMSVKDLTAYFSHFGTVEDVDFVVLDPVTMKRKSYCFIGFSSMDEAENVASMKELVLGSYLLKVSLSKSKMSAVKQTKELIVRSLPCDVTIHNIKEYFEQFGTLEQIDLICQPVSRSHTTYAFVKFDSPCAVEKATEKLIHSILGKKVVVQKTALTYPIKHGDTKLFVEGLQLDANPEKVKAYFAKYGKLKHINEKSIASTGSTHVVFKSNKAVQKVLMVTCHVFDECKLKIRPVAWKKPPHMISTFNKLQHLK